MVNILSGVFYQSYLEKSDNLWQRKLVAKASFYTGKKEGNIFKKILTDGNDVIITSRVSYFGWLTKNQEFQNTGNVKFAKEAVIPFDIEGWAVQKNSPWLEALNKQILTLDRAKNN